MESDSLQGQLLIASPTLLDPNFVRTVVLVTAHTDEGAMGVVLNRPSGAAAGEALPHLERLLEDGGRIHVGGPVEPGAVVVLAEFDDPDDAAAVVFGDVGFVPAEGDPDDLADSVGRARAFAGYAGWGPEQLESELARDDWFLEPAEAGDVFAEEPGELWSDVLRRKGGQFALLATMPPDPSMN